MKKTLGYVAAALGAVALLGATALPASAAVTGDTDVTFTLTAIGDLAITVQDDAALTDGQAGDTSVTGSLGDIVVTDLRGSNAGWEISAASTTFVGSIGASVSSGVTFTAGGPTNSTGTVTPSVGAATNVSNGAEPVAEGTAAQGNNTATYAPDLTVALPTTALAGDYTGTVTTSVA